MKIQKQRMLSKQKKNEYYKRPEVQEKIKIKRAQKTRCEICECEVTKCHFKRHLESIKHIENAKSKSSSDSSVDEVQKKYAKQYFASVVRLKF